MVIEMHRYMLPEFNTHRDFSRNSASSRAIPVHKVLKAVRDNPALPLIWRAEQKGMAGGEPLSPEISLEARKIWLEARDHAAASAERLVELGVHKSTTNRLIEPFLNHTVIVTATNWRNFFAQRCSHLAQDDIRVLAEVMLAAFETSTPVVVPNGDWHLPFISAEELDKFGSYFCRRVSAARCARVSYLTHEGIRDIDADLALFDRLKDAEPPHASPLEHVATPESPRTKKHLGNFNGWTQLRHMLLEPA